LTPAQQRILGFIEDEIQSGRPPPTLREIAAEFGFKSHRAAACHLDALKRKGFIESEPGKARSSRLKSSLGEFRHRILEIPLFGSIPAGFSQDRQQEAEGCVSIDVASIGIKPTQSVFALRVTGDSMTGRHILDGDIVVLEHGPEPIHGEIVAALIDGESTLKTFVRKDNRSYLKSENPKYPDMIPAEHLMIQGIFRSVIRKAKR
jgi:repressor LexA